MEVWFGVKGGSMFAALAVPLFSLSPAAYAGGLPSGGSFVAGNGSIGGSGAALTIQQSSPRGIICRARRSTSKQPVRKGSSAISTSVRICAGSAGHR